MAQARQARGCRQAGGVAGKRRATRSRQLCRRSHRPAASRAMNAAELGGPLLKSVSRSFYLSIRILPRDLQAPIGLAYLLARASDTIADTADASETVRLRHL